MLFVYKHHYEKAAEGTEEYNKLNKELSAINLKWIKPPILSGSFRYAQDESRKKEIIKRMEQIEPPIIKEWDKILSYELYTVPDTILPKLALQFSNNHFVSCEKPFDGVDTTYVKPCLVEARILDYEINGTSGSSPEDLLFK